MASRPVIVAPAELGKGWVPDLYVLGGYLLLLLTLVFVFCFVTGRWPR